MKLNIGNITSESFKGKKLFIGTPMYGGQNYGMYTRSMVDLITLMTKYKIPVQIYYLFNESLITRARAYICDEFMRSDATHMLFLDSDIGFDARDVLAMLHLQNDDSPYDVLCAPYPKKTISWEKIKTAVYKGFADENPENLARYVGDYVFNPKAGVTQFKLNEPVEILEGGTGFMMIQRKVFDRYQERFPELWFRPDHVRTEQFDGSRKIMMYFDCKIDRGYDFGDAKKVLQAVVEDKITPELKQKVKDMLENEEKNSLRYLSEDYFFSQNIQKIGMKIWLCPWMKTQHVGTYIFGGSLFDLAQLGVSATVDPSQLVKSKNAKQMVTPGGTQRVTLPDFLDKKTPLSTLKNKNVVLPGLPGSKPIKG